VVWRWRPGRVLALGARGERVRTLQETLAALGFDPGPIDGVYGLLTRQAVRECQRRYGLVADGVAGPQLHRLFREPALRLGPSQALLGLLPPGEAGPWARWAGAYPALSAFVWSSRLASWEPARIELAAKAWSHQLAEAGAGTPAAPPWIWRLTFGPPQGAEAPAGNGREGTEAGRRPEEFPLPWSGPGRRARRALVAAITSVVDRFRPLGVDLDLEPVWPGDEY